MEALVCNSTGTSLIGYHILIGNDNLSSPLNVDNIFAKYRFPFHILIFHVIELIFMHFQNIRYKLILSILPMS